MNRLVIWIIAIIILVGFGWFLLGNSGDDSDTVQVKSPGDNLEEAEDSTFENVETTDQILNEIDDSLNYIE